MNDKRTRRLQQPARRSRVVLKPIQKNRSRALHDAPKPFTIGSSEIRPITAFRRTTEGKPAAMEQDRAKTIVIPGGSYRPGRFPALERYKREWEGNRTK